MAKPEVGLLGTSGIVGPCILLATGAGYSAMLLGKDTLGVAFFGDGASNNGAFHEGLNMAAAWKPLAQFVRRVSTHPTHAQLCDRRDEPDRADRARRHQARLGLPEAS